MKGTQFTYIAIIVTLLLHVVILAVLNYVPLGNTAPAPEYIAMDMMEVVEEIEERTLEEILAERIEQDIANLVADANAESSSERRNYMSESQRNRISDEVDQELQDLADQTFEAAAERRSDDPNEDPSESNPDELNTDNLDKYEYYGQSYNGNVTGEVNVPGREVRKLHIPGYKCKGGGVVVIKINVDINGNVTEAEIDPARSSFTGECIPEEAVSSALKSKFFVKSSAPKKSPGTITYRFIPQ